MGYRRAQSWFPQLVIGVDPGQPGALRVGGDTMIDGYLYLRNGVYSCLRFQFANGDKHAPVVPPASGVIIARVTGEAWDGVAYGIASAMVFEAGTNFGAASHNGLVAWQACLAGETTLRTMARLQAFDFNVVRNTNDGLGTLLGMRKSRGAVGAELYPLANDYLGTLYWSGYDEASAAQQPSVSIIGMATNANWSAANRGAKLLISTIKEGETALTGRWFLLDTGSLRPYADQVVDIGDATHLVKAGYFKDLTVKALGAGTGLLSVGAADSAGAGFRQVRVPN